MVYSSIYPFTATENPVVREYQADPSFLKEHWYYIPIVGTVILTAIIGSVICYNCRKDKKKPQQVIMNMQPNSLYSRVADELRHSLPYDPRWEFPREK